MGVTNELSIKVTRKLAQDAQDVAYLLIKACDELEILREVAENAVGYRRETRKSVDTGLGVHYGAKIDMYINSLDPEKIND